METTITVENKDTLKTLQAFLKSLLETGAVEALLVPMRTPGGTVTPALVTEPRLLDQADPLAPVLPVNSADLACKLSVRQPRAKIGVVMRSCELRALIELTKMQQASLDDLTLIAMDCAGTYSVPVYLKKTTALQPAELWQELFQSAVSQPEQPKAELRLACQICEQPVYAPRPDKDIVIELLGVDCSQEIHLALPAELAARINEKWSVEGSNTYLKETQPGGRPSVVDKLVATRTAAREVEFASIRERLEGEGASEAEGIARVFAACIRCHNCMTVCPICYCKTCVFKSAVFDHEPMQFINWAKQKGAFRLPSDTMLFHLTRLNHMVLSCVGCGMCSEACPSELPVGLVFRAVGQRLQSTFEYAPGRNFEEPLPLVTFKADEWTEVGE